MRFLMGFAFGVLMGFVVIAVATGDSGSAAVAQVRARRRGPAEGAASA